VAKKKSEQFEEALRGIERIVEKLEKGDLPLEEAMDAFSEGVRLVKQCQKKLEEAEAKVQVLLDDQQTEALLAPFELPAGDEVGES
jgi:exodeoxyribonuclease VII small subunit